MKPRLHPVTLLLGAALVSPLGAQTTTTAFDLSGATAFWRTYREAALRTGGRAYVLSDSAMSMIGDVERRYRVGGAARTPAKPPRAAVR